MRRLLVTIAIIVVLLCCPVALFFLGWGLKQVYVQFGMFAFLVACFSYFIAALGVASLIDTAREQQRQPPHGQ